MLDGTRSATTWSHPGASSAQDPAPATIDYLWIRSEFSRTGKLQKDLATALGVSASAISKLLEGKRRLRLEEVPVVLEFFGRSPQASAPAASMSESGESPEIVLRLAPRAAGCARYEMTAASIMSAVRPRHLDGVQGAYAVYAPGGDLEPRFRMGEILYVHPDRPPRLGDCAVVELDEAGGVVMIGEVLGSDGGKLTLASKGGAAIVDMAGAKRLGRVVLVEMA